MTRRTSHWVLLLAGLAGVLALGCGDDTMGADSGMPADAGDSGTSPGDSSVPDDSATPSDSGAPVDGGDLCTPSTCVNGACDGDTCDCDPGWTGLTCETLNAPTEDGVLLWFDADDPDAFMTTDVAGTLRVDEWVARTAVSGPVAVSPLVAEQKPALVTDPAFANGRPTVAFEAAGTALTNNGAFWGGINGVTEHTIFVVFSSSAVLQAAVSVNERATEDGVAVGSGNDFGSIAGVQRTTVAASPSDFATINRLHLATLRVSADGTMLRVDQTDASAVGVADPLAVDMGEVILGAQSRTGAQPLGGNVAEVIVFTGALRTGVMDGVEDYLTAKWL